LAGDRVVRELMVEGFAVEVRKGPAAAYSVTVPRIKGLMGRVKDLQYADIEARRLIGSFLISSISKMQIRQR
jgi:hypothetical protein